MKLEETIQYLYDKYPMLFRTREECLNHLFCTVGNGFEWYKGELIEKHNIIYSKEVMKRKKNNTINLSNNEKAQQKIIDKRYDKWRSKYPFIWSEIYEGHSCITTYPINIKKDWLDGINETKKILGI